MSFPNQVNSQQGTAWPGDPASQNPAFYSLLGDQGQFVAAAAGVTVGKFVWIQVRGANEGPTVGNVQAGGGSPDGFVRREQQALITTYLGETSMVIPGGFPVTPFVAGDFFATNVGAVAYTRGHKVFARLTDGAVGVSQAGDASDLPGGSGAWVSTVFLAAGNGPGGDLCKITSAPVA